ncbi:hypothetical protein PSHT_15522 [Puccinia striiformis]|uniref:HAT C-terminal dimerisation domain-containing protein n=1 Tax=Puccinia striiformis TaxID=27350 RepID=A0A2S4UED4_9BASI|nr:hypothetical protein PSHT_15522 [Puccinia striiformis]
MARGRRSAATSTAGSGNDTDHSQNPRRSSRVTTPLRSNALVSTPADSRLSLAAPPNASAQKRRRQGTASPAGSGLPSSVGTVAARTNQPPNNRPRKLPPKPTKPVKRSVFHPSKNKTVASKTPGSAATPDGIALSTDIVASQEPSEVYDYDQDSEVEIEQIESKARNRKADDDDDNNFSYVEDFFEPPFWKKGDPPNTALNFRCKWCRVPYRIHETSRANLRTHRDGAKQAGKNNHGCKNRAKAKKAGHRLPETVAERLAREAQDSKQTKLTGFVPTKRFECRVLNQILVIWQVRHALPWSRIEDAKLRAAFLYANKDARLYSRRWSADEAKQLYAGLRKKVFEELDNLDTTFTLIHDVWTTKGNRFAFIGAAVTYIDSNWQFVVRHLALKMIPWKHKGELLARPIVNLLKKRNLHEKITQTTDSGSNNNTMASTMYELFDLDSDGQSNWDPTSMHIRCACHKFALIVNAGLQALTLKILPPAKIKQSVLGFFPVLGKLPEVTEADENEIADPDPEVQEVNQLADIPEEDEGEEAYESDYGNADDEGSHTDSESEVHPDDEEEAELPQAQLVNTNERTSRSGLALTGSVRHIKSAKLQALTDQLDVVIKQITRSAAQRSLFEQTAKSMGIQCAPLIAGYGIRWNIKYESHRRALLAREVIDRILKEDQESMEQSRRKSRGRNTAANISQFDDVTFSPGDWQDIQELNWELEVFVRLTQEMEGNHSSGAHVIPKYLELKEDLEETMRVSKAMHCTRCTVQWRNGSQSISPKRWLRRSSTVQPIDSGEFARIKEKVSSKAAGLLKTLTPDTQQKQSTSTNSKGLMACLALLNKKTPLAQEHELQLFLTADMTFRTEDITDQDFPLKWWKVCLSHLPPLVLHVEHKTDLNNSVSLQPYPTIAIMARSYLATSASSCAVERLFSAASDVCSNSRGRLLSATMSRSVNSLMWLREDIPLTGSFETAGKILSDLIPKKKTNKKL